MKSLSRFLIGNLFFIASATTAVCQDSLDYFNPATLEKSISYLASDELKGRGNFTPSLEKAGLYIAQEFQKTGLKYHNNSGSYFFPFVFMDKDMKAYEDVLVNGKALEIEDYLFYTSYYLVPPIQKSDLAIKRLPLITEENAIDQINVLIDNIKEPILVILPTRQKKLLYFIKKNQNKLHVPFHSLLILPDIKEVNTIEINVKEEVRKRMLFNVVGVLPGKSLKNEYVIISAHYDHIGMDYGNRDSIFNGANDNASGVAAMLAMATYFSETGNNERTLIFIGFSGEEIGLVGSKFMASYFEQTKIVAMFNLEMLGKVNQNGKGRIIMTGIENSSLGSIMRKYCQTIKIEKDFYDDEMLFSRSDNYPFALKGVFAAHTFMCFTKNDQSYHQTSDEISTLDIENMSLLLKGLLPGIEAVTSGKETPQK